MTPELAVLAGTAATLGATHTAIGVDHTLPFIMLGRARQWSLTKTLAVTSVCAVGHDLTSVLIGAQGNYGLGLALPELEAIAIGRGHFAAWGLIAFGAIYAVVGWWRMRREDAHRHFHVHADGTVHTHDHAHGTSDGQLVHHHRHPSRAARQALPLESKRLIPGLFLIFVLGPCEALIPLMAAPALSAQGGAVMIATVFGLATTATMLALVTLGYLGLNIKAIDRLEPHLQWIAGFAIFVSGLGVEFLGV